MSRDEGRMALKRLLRDAISAPTLRDKQLKVGPSDLGYRCDFCLGLKLTRLYPELRPPDYELRDNFGLKAWMGTGAHHQMEVGLAQVADPDEWTLVIEGSFPVYELAGYGTIKGHVDVVAVHRTGYVAIVDHKTCDKARLRSYKLHGVPEEYVFQTDLYGFGVEQQTGSPPLDVGINFIPRDSNNLDDTWQCFAPYNRSVAEMALVRLEEVWQQVQAGNVMELEQDPDCWDCGRRY